MLIKLSIILSANNLIYWTSAVSTTLPYKGILEKSFIVDKSGPLQRTNVLFSYSPLGQGRLLDNEDVMKIARRRTISPASMLLRWTLRKGVRTCMAFQITN
jgi:hypothetical protein